VNHLVCFVVAISNTISTLPNQWQTTNHSKDDVVSVITVMNDVNIIDIIISSQVEVSKVHHHLHQLIQGKRLVVVM
jgi:hypothetical protein